MKKTLVTFVAILTSVVVYAQDYPVDMYYSLNKSYCGWKSGSKVHLSKVSHDTKVSSTDTYPVIEEEYFLYEEGSNEPHEVKNRFDGAMSCDYKKVSDIWNHYVIGNVLNMIQKKGFQVPLRNELEDDALDFIYKLQNDGRTFKDPYLENYIYSLVAKIAPVTLVDGRPGNCSIVILNDDEQNAFTFSNGTIVVTTGLLSSLHTEDELVGILSHEIAHFVLDHSVANVNQNTKREKRAAFWAAFATGVTAAAEGVAAAKNPYYKPGAATIAVAAISTTIALEYLERAGMKYNHEQENDADRISKEVLKLLGYDQNGLASALAEISKKYQEERTTAVYYSSYTHPSLLRRISGLGSPSDKRDTNFEKMVSFAVSSAAMKKYESRRYRQALELVNQNVSNNVATSDDYIIRASCMLALQNDPASNQEALNSVNRAKSLCINDLNIYKPEIVALLRLNKKTEAMNVLTSYETAIAKESERLKNIESDVDWSYWNNYLNTESSWANNMLIKLKGM